MYLLFVALVILLGIYVFALRKQIDELQGLHEHFSDDIYKYKRILHEISKIESKVSLIASSDCKNRRREARKVLKMIDVIKEIKKEIL